MTLMIELFYTIMGILFLKIPTVLFNILGDF